MSTSHGPQWSDPTDSGMATVGAPAKAETKAPLATVATWQSRSRCGDSQALHLFPQRECNLIQHRLMACIMDFKSKRASVLSIFNLSPPTAPNCLQTALKNLNSLHIFRWKGEMELAILMANSQRISPSGFT